MWEEVKGQIAITWIYIMVPHTDGFMHDCGNSSVLAMELLQSFMKPSLSHIPVNFQGYQPKIILIEC